LTSTRSGFIGMAAVTDSMKRRERAIKLNLCIVAQVGLRTVGSCEMGVVVVRLFISPGEANENNACNIEG
jgi:hypothetical protein